MKTAFLYVRVSTDEQADKGYSLRSQEETLRRWCAIHNIEIKGIFTEDHSAKTFNRPEFTRMLITLKKHRGIVNTVLFTKWDRFSRNTGDAYSMISTLNKAGAEPQAVEQPLDLFVPENKIMLAFYLAAPEVENDRRALNTYAGMRRASKEGRWMGPAPVGYVNKISEKGRKFITPSDNAHLIKWLFEQVATGKYSIESLILQVQKQGITQKRMALWAALRNPVYCGKVRVMAWKNEPEDIVRGQHDPIISEAIWYKVQDVLDGKKKERRMNIVVDDRFPLRGFLICPNCTRILTASASKGMYKYYSYYHCTGSCKIRFNADKVNSSFIAELQKFKPLPAIMELYKLIVKSEYLKSDASRRNELNAIKEDINRLTERKKNALKKLEEDILDPDDYRQIKTECERGIIELEDRSTRLIVPVQDVEPALDAACSLLINLDQLYTNASTINKRELVSSIYPEKLEFSGEFFRTAKVNEVISTIYTLGKAFSGLKKENPSQKTEISSMVARTRIELVSRV